LEKWQRPKELHEITDKTKLAGPCESVNVCMKSSQIHKRE